MNEDAKRWLIFVARDSPLPLNRGHRMRFWAMAQYLRRFYRVGILFYGSFPGIGEVRKGFDEVWTCDPPYAPPRTAPLAWLGHVIRERRKQRHVQTFYAEASRYVDIARMDYPPYAPAAMDELFAALKPLAVVSEYIWAAAPALVVARRLGIPTMIDTIDLFARRRAEESGAEGKLQFDITEEDETRLLSLGDVLIAIQGNERDWFAEHVPGSRAVLAEHPCDGGGPGSVAQKAGMLLFVGSASRHNANGIRFFLEGPWPEIRAAVPSVELHICGTVCDELPAAVRLTSGVYCHGVVPDLVDFYGAATVVVVPLLYGSGLKVKTVEALCHGRCVVATPAGADGLEDCADRAFALAGPERIGERVCELLRDTASRRGFEQEARRLAASRFTPEACFSELRKVLRQWEKQPGSIED